MLNLNFYMFCLNFYLFYLNFYLFYLNFYLFNSNYMMEHWSVIMKLIAIFNLDFFLQLQNCSFAPRVGDDHDQYHFLRFEDQPWPLREKISNSKSGLHNDGYFQWQMVRKMNAQFQKVSVPPRNTGWLNSWFTFWE